jgi:hypothetical protein
VAASRWLEEVYDVVMAAIPDQLRGRLAPAEIFHEIMEHRWYLSEAAGRDVGTTAAAKSYFETVLPTVPEPLAEDDPEPPAEDAWEAQTEDGWGPQAEGAWGPQPEDTRDVQA